MEKCLRMGRDGDLPKGGPSLDSPRRLSGAIPSTYTQVRKTAWLPIMARSGIDYRNPYQIRHTYASTLLTAGGNPWYVAQQLGHEDVEMVFRTYGKFIREDYQKPKAVLRSVQ